MVSLEFFFFLRFAALFTVLIYRLATFTITL